MINEIQKILKDAIGKEIGEVTVSEKPEFGDYATNAAFLLSREVKKAPMEVARDIVARIQNQDDSIFERIDVAPPGFINFRIKPEVVWSYVLAVVKEKQKKPTKKKKINLEFISANPTGPLTMANGRGGFYGDVLANILSYAGHAVTREYYINDAGNQVALLGASILEQLSVIPFKPEHYQGQYIKDLAWKKFKNTKIHDPAELGRLAAAELLKEIKASLKRAGISFDVWFSEYEKIHQKGAMKKVLEVLKKRGLILEKEGAVWLKTSDIEDDKDRVLVKSDGQPTYFLADIAYHYDKLITRKFDLAIDIWGADHHGYIGRLKSGVRAIGAKSDQLEIIIMQLVRLVQGGEEVRMSKRKGNFVTLDELMDEAGKDATRFFFLMHSPETHMDFDLDLAKEKSMSNPVFYVQYAYVRAYNIIENARAIPLSATHIEHLTSESELGLMKVMMQLPDVLAQTVEDYQVSRLPRYAMELARAFHSFYEKERVIGEDVSVMKARLALVGAAKAVFERVFKIIGIEAIRKM